ncbi:hypothetical protein [Micromonospora globbae]|uniref:hypothetical protein n=1 Tax=Micromonospora globbae TaxID=1894969 RepID=UPI00344A66A9
MAFSTEPGTARYAWVITEDLDNPYDEDLDGLALPTRVGLSGPSQATEEEILRALRTGAFFRLRDDDANTYYIGRCWCADGPGAPEMFGPLGDWGRADVGATEIQYRAGGRWEAL